MATTNQKKFLDQTPVQRTLVGRFHHRFLQVLSELQPTSILEAGCGEGYLLSAMHRQLPELPMVGYDNLPAALTAGKKVFPKLDMRHGDIYHLPEHDRSWDVVIASEVLEHLDRPAEALKEMSRVAKRYVMLSVPHEPWFRLGNLARGRHLKRLGNHPEHINLWTRASFRDFVQRQAAVVTTTSSFPWTIVVAKV